MSDSKEQSIQSLTPSDKLCRSLSLTSRILSRLEMYSFPPSRCCRTDSAFRFRRRKRSAFRLAGDFRERVFVPDMNQSIYRNRMKEIKANATCTKKQKRNYVNEYWKAANVTILITKRDLHKQINIWKSIVGIFI